MREAKKAFARFKTQCFWSFDPELKITYEDIPWVVEQLRNNGDQKAWRVAERLCP